ncbi:hypothetical protein K3495_g13826 [Podosphaera aphanis]|nr:hypothetical protein K3495_g13826 [Podosphaera aphanis]
MSNRDYYGDSGNSHQSGQSYNQSIPQNTNNYDNYQRQNPPYPHEQSHGGHNQASFPDYIPAPTHDARVNHSQPPYGDSRGHNPQQPYHDGSNPNYQPYHSVAGSEGPGQQDERGLGATIVGGASGGLLAHKAGGGLMGSVLGSVAGAIGANIIEHKLEGRHKKKSSKHDKHGKHKKEKKEKHKKHGSREAHSDSSSSSSDSD